MNLQFLICGDKKRILVRPDRLPITRRALRIYDKHLFKYEWWETKWYYHMLWFNAWVADKKPRRKKK